MPAPRSPKADLRLPRLALAALAALLPILASGGALCRTLNCELLRPGYELDPDELQDTLGRKAFYHDSSGRTHLDFPSMDATEQRAGGPSVLLLSNSPEVLSSSTLPKRAGVLLRSQVEPGSFRVLSSHSNATGSAYDLVLRAEAVGTEAAELQVTRHHVATANLIPGTQRLDSMVGASLLAHYLSNDSDSDVTRLARGTSRIVMPGTPSDLPLVRDFRGLACTLTEATTSAPIKLSLAAIPNGGTLDEGLKALPRVPPQVRGRFAQPDLQVTARVDVRAGTPQRYVFGKAERTQARGMLAEGNWMRGSDTTLDAVEPMLNKGDFGGFTQMHVEVAPSEASQFRGALLLLVSGGPKAAICAPGMRHGAVLERWRARVVARLRAGESWDYTFTLPPNSWAPVYLVSVPLRTP